MHMTSVPYVRLGNLSSRHAVWVTLDDGFVVTDESGGFVAVEPEMLQEIARLVVLNKLADAK